MNLVDSCGWLEYFADAANADFFAAAIEDTSQLIVPSICLVEVFKRVLQQRGEHDALRAAALMQQARVIDVDSRLALSAARLSTDFKLPMADSLILATARMQDATVWTQDSHFEGLPGVRYIGKPN
ncbi:MAG: type II toxin-antitoxin system VapC family toxin [Pseudomonadota bacterium]|nr:type II toxin-antitoxin system VapC family toxin [Pseudomonadota bacterium]